uniref:PID domain-containing protein n=1 Tax=Haemonchus contortus TaxID=6289 RepID=A0A7I4Y3I9_HAECO|nr:unnamed protein product [Haemonchus contortus]
MIQPQAYTVVPLSVNPRPNHIQSVFVPVQPWPAPIAGAVPVAVPCIPMTQRYVVYRYPMMQAAVSTPFPVPVAVTVPQPAPPSSQVATSTASSMGYDSGIAFMNTSDPSLAVDVSLSLPSSPNGSASSETSPLPTVEDPSGIDDLNTAFDGRDFDSAIFQEKPKILSQLRPIT